MRARSAECRNLSPASPEELEQLELRLWRDKHKVLIDTWELEDNDFKQKVIQYANNKFKGKK